MKKILALSIFALLATGAMAQKVDYGIDLDYLANNGMYDSSANIFEQTGFFHAVNFSPRIGMTFSPSSRVTHSVMFGADFYKNLGTGLKTWDLMQEFLYYYRFDLSLGRRATVSGIAGSYPKSFLDSELPLALYSEVPRFTDRNFEGFAFKFNSRSLYADLAFDFSGVATPKERERYQVLSSGGWRIFPELSAGWHFYHMHFGAFQSTGNKVNTFYLYPYVKYAPHTPLQRLSLTAGWIQSLQSDTAQDKTVFPGGVLANLTVGHWGFGISNDFYTGTDLMPFFGTTYDGVKYGHDVYPGSAFYHTHIDGFSFYDRVELFYEPRLGDWATLRLSAICHLGNPTSQFGVIRGWQQSVSLRFNIDSFRSLKK